MISNKTYSRITHATKQREFLGHNPLMKSTPNFDFSKIRETRDDASQSFLLPASTSHRQFSSPDEAPNVLSPRSQTHLFEEFFIIGLDQDHLKQISGMGMTKPDTLHMFVGELESGDYERRKVVKDFCFPDGIAY